MLGDLPEYECPPLNEVVAGVQFEPLERFHAAHLGLYWARVRDRYPSTEDQPPLAHMKERERPPQPFTQASLMFQAGPIVPRCWFLDESKTKLIQIQPDRFLRNWRQIEGTEAYPRFGTLMLADLPPSPQKFWEIASPATLLVVLGLLAIHAERAFSPQEGPFSRKHFGLAFFWSGQALLAAGLLLVFAAEVAGDWL